MIGPVTDEKAREPTKKTKSTIPCLFDEDAAVVQAYRLAYELPDFFQELYAQTGPDLPTWNPTTGWLMLVPATFVVGRDRKVRARYANGNHRYRMEPADVLAAVKGAASA